MGFFDSWKMRVHTQLRHGVYYPGNIVEGFVEVTASGPISMVAVRVKACGKERIIIRRERTYPNDDPSQPPRREIETFRESNVVYKQLVTLAGQMKCYGRRDAVMLPPGNFTYPFSFQLPLEIPPSLANRSGNGGETDEADILYYIKAYVDIPMGRDAVHRSFFTVVKPMPQSQWVHRAPANVERDFQITMCCCIDKGRVHAQIHMDRTMISIDRDNLTIGANIDNTQGQNPVESLEITLIHTLQYRAMGRSETNRVQRGRQFIEQQVPAGQKGQILGTIPLPRDIIPSLSTWNLTSEYVINIEMNIPWATDPKQSFPVIVAQSVDETNYSPPVQFGQCNYPRFGKNEYKEFYYQPPPQPCYNYSPAPLPPPMNVPMFTFDMTPQLPLPPSGFLSPTVYGAQPGSPGPRDVQWQSGFTQNVAVVHKSGGISMTANDNGGSVSVTVSGGLDSTPLLH